MSDTAQLGLFEAVPQRRRKLKEKRAVYEVVELLRAGGHAVYRAGDDHFMVDGERLSWVHAKGLADAARRLMERTIGAVPG